MPLAARHVHDVWVHDGIAYSSKWGTGVAAVDVGNGKWGGTIEQSKLIAALHRLREVPMVPLMSLWIPILLSAVLAFVASSIIHMVLPYHRSDFNRVPNEDGVMQAIGKVGVPPGEYVMPYAGSPEAMKAPEFVEKRNRGPVAVLTVMPSGPPSMGKNLAQWFLYCVVVSLFAAYVASRASPPGAEYLSVFRFAGTTAFIAYSLALWQNSIWYKRPWSTTLKQTFDGLVYALLTAGAFGWLWPA